MKRLSIFEISLTGMILAIAIAAKYFDRFIPHVHPLHIVILLIGISIMRFRVSVILIATYIIVKMLLFGPTGITGFMITFHIFSTISLLIVSSASPVIKKMNGKYKKLIIVPIIIFAMIVALTLKVIGDSDYTPKTTPFFERARLALIYPGDWLNALIATSLSIAIVPIAYVAFEKTLKQNLEKTLW